MIGGRLSLAGLPVFLPLVSFIIVFLVWRRRGTGVRDSLVNAAVFLGVIAVIATELQSAAGTLTHRASVLIWATAVLVPLVVVFRMTPAADRQPALHDRPLHGWFTRAMLVAIALLAATMLFLAVVAPPAFGDALSYHMARVAHWLQNGSVAHYPTHIDRQVWSPPGAEFMILQLQLLSRSDVFANLVQWAAFAGSSVVVSLIALKLGADNRGQVLAAFVFATVPMAIAQATGAQNDLVAGFWLLTFVYLSFRIGEADGSGARIWELGLLGCSLGLAVLTKGTNYIFAAPFALWWLARELKRDRRRLFSVTSSLAVAVIALNAGHYARNLRVYGSPLGPTDFNTTAVVTPASVFSNTIRNLSLHLGTPDDTRLPLSIELHRLIEGVVREIHSSLGMDINDPRTTLTDSQFHVPVRSRSENNAGNPFHLILIVGMLAAYAASRRERTRLVSGYLAAMAVSTLLFFAMVRWHSSNARLHLPIFMLAAAPLGFLLARRLPKPALYVITLGLASQAFSQATKNPARPLLGNNQYGNAAFLQWSRERRFFAELGVKDAYRPYVGAAEFLKQQRCRSVGLITGWAEWEYAFHVVASNRVPGLRLYPVHVQNPSRASASARATPPSICAITGLHQDGSRPPDIESLFPGYRVAWQEDSVSVLLPVHRVE